MNRIDRLFGMLTFLQSRRYVTAEQIAEKFGISIRTVYRDIRALDEQGIPISFEAGKGYCVVQGYFLPPVSFSSEEANALLLMEAMVLGFADKSIQKNYTSALSKVKAVLPAARKEQLELLTQNIRFQISPCLSASYEYLTELQNAISARQILSIDYQNNKAEVSSREVESIGLVFYAFSWHLIAWCHLRAEYRDFKVSRILKIRNTGKPFQKTEHMPLADYMKLLPVAY